MRWRERRGIGGREDVIGGGKTERKGQIGG